MGADLSAPLGALAEQRAREDGADNVEFRRLDMQTDRIPGDPFTVAISQFGVMFFDDPVAAFGNIRAHLAPDGRIAFACWQRLEDNPWHFASAISEFLPSPPPPPRAPPPPPPSPPPQRGGPRSTPPPPSAGGRPPPPHAAAVAGGGHPQHNHMTLTGVPARPNQPGPAGGPAGLGALGGGQRGPRPPPGVHVNQAPTART